MLCLYTSLLSLVNGWNLFRVILMQSIFIQCLILFFGSVVLQQLAKFIKTTYITNLAVSSYVLMFCFFIGL